MHFEHITVKYKTVSEVEISISMSPMKEFTPIILQMHNMVIDYVLGTNLGS